MVSVKLNFINKEKYESVLILISVEDGFCAQIYQKSSTKLLVLILISVEDGFCGGENYSSCLNGY